MLPPSTPNPNSPTSFDPLNPSGIILAQYANAYIRNNVSNILQSYHGRMDAFVEIIQNAMDALEKRWENWDGLSPLDPNFPLETPYLRINIDYTTETVEVLDNGTGLEKEHLEVAFIPNFSVKNNIQNQVARGHKGVGTTFLAYGHDLFEFHTKSNTLEAAYRIEKGLTWAKGETITNPPMFNLTDVHSDLSSISRGTLVKLQMGPGTSYGSLSSTYHTSVDLWKHALCTFTAVGHLGLGLEKKDSPPWLASLKVDLRLSGPVKGSVQFNPAFHFPHQSGTGSAVKELQWLQNNPGTTPEFELIYAERNHGALKQLLRDKLQELEESADPGEREKAAVFLKYKISAYASLACRNTYYDNFTARAISKDGAKKFSFQNIRGGILAATVSMPAGETQESTNLLQPQERRRLFMVIHFNEKYRPDIGRKMMPTEVIPTVEWLENELLRLLRSQSGRLIRDKSDAVHQAANFQDAQEQLAEAVKDINTKRASTPELPYPLPVKHRAFFEPEVAAAFCSLVAGTHLPGYELLAIPGNGTRYDVLFNFSAAKAEIEPSAGEIPLGIAEQYFGKGKPFSRKDKWLEFKVDLSDLFEDMEKPDGEAGKKYFEQIALAVVWDIGKIGGYNFEVEVINEKSWRRRNYYASTHLVRQDHNVHQIEVIELSSLLPRLFPNL